MLWPAERESTERRCLAVQTPDHEAQSNGQQCMLMEHRVLNIHLFPPPMHMLCTRPGWQHAGTELHCVLRPAESTEPCRKVGEFHTQGKRLLNACGAEHTRCLEHAKLKLGDSEGMERGMVSMRGEVQNTEISCHPGWWQSHLCCSSVLGP